jgi:hypothetical protein
VSSGWIWNGSKGRILDVYDDDDDDDDDKHKTGRVHCEEDFDVLLTVHLSIILAINQLNAQNLFL